MEENVHLAIDAKAFFAPVECAARRLDPLTANMRLLRLQFYQKMERISGIDI